MLDAKISKSHDQNDKKVLSLDPKLFSSYEDLPFTNSVKAPKSEKFIPICSRQVWRLDGTTPSVEKEVNTLT